MTEKVELTSEDKAVRFFKATGFQMAAWTFSLYFTLLYMTVWNWFLSDRFFTVGYWEMFLGVIVIRYIMNSYTGSKAIVRLDREIGKQSYATQTTDLFSIAIVRTLTFGILYIVHLMISYYS